MSDLLQSRLDDSPNAEDAAQNWEQCLNMLSHGRHYLVGKPAKR